MRMAIFLLIMVASCFFMTSCCPKVLKSHDYRDSVRIEYRDQYHEKVLRDTTYLRDSIFVRDKGDTVLIYRDRYHYVDRFIKDTIRLADTVYLSVYKDRIEVVEKKHIPQFFWWCFGIALVAIAYVARWIYRKIKMHLTSIKFTEKR